MLLADDSRLQRNLSRLKRVEDAWRERAFLPVTDVINGVTVRQLTLLHLTILFQVRSPFLGGIASQPEHVGQFLWVISPQYDMHNRESRRAFLEALVAQYPPEKFRLFYRGIRRYLFRHFHFDAPPRTSKGQSVAACFAAGILHKLKRGGHTEPDDALMQLPIARIFQYLKWIAAEDNPRIPQFNALQAAFIQRWAEQQEAAA
jgi:hypothetical protein